MLNCSGGPHCENVLCYFCCHIQSGTGAGGAALCVDCDFVREKNDKKKVIDLPPPPPPLVAQEAFEDSKIRNVGGARPSVTMASRKETDGVVDITYADCQIRMFDSDYEVCAFFSSCLSLHLFSDHFLLSFFQVLCFTGGKGKKSRDGYGNDAHLDFALREALMELTGMGVLDLMTCAPTIQVLDSMYFTTYINTKERTDGPFPSVVASARANVIIGAVYSAPTVIVALPRPLLLFFFFTFLLFPPVPSLLGTLWILPCGRSF